MKISLKTGAAAVCAVFAVLMLPIVITCFYTYPVLDDLNFGARAHQAVMDGGSVLWAALQNAGSFYMHWQGDYTANFVAGIQPFVWNGRLYFLSGLFGIFWVSGIMLFFFYTVLCKALHLPKSLWLLSTALLLILFWELLPSASEGIYWMDGSLGISFYSIVFLISALLLRYFMAKGEKRWHIAAACCILSAILGGTNQSNVLTLALAGAAALCFPEIRRDSTGKIIIISVCLAMAGMAVNILAPGTSTRLGELNGVSLPKAIVFAVYYGFVCFAQWMDVARIGVLMIMCILAFPILKKTPFKFPCPFAVVIGCFGIYSCAIAVTVFAKGHLGDDRQLNYYFLSFTYSTAVMMVYLTGWLAKKYPKAMIIDGKTIPVGLILAVAIMFTSGMLNSGFHSLTSVDTAWGLYKGYTQKYAAEMKVRTEILENPEITDAILEPLSQTLTYLPFDPLSTDPDYWTNQSTAAFYRKTSVRLISEE